MQNKFKLCMTFAVVVILNSCINKTKMPEAPQAKRIAKELIIHGDARIDQYYWMNDRENKDVIDYLNAENNYLEESLAHVKEFRTALFEEIKGRIKQTDMSVPYKSNGYYYYTRYEEGTEYPIHCRKKDNIENEEEILLNVNDMAKGYAYYQLGSYSISPDNKLMAYSFDTVSRRLYTIKIMNLETGEIFSEEIKNTSGGAVWANDNKTFFYTQKDESLRPNKIFRHQLGIDVQKDVLVYHESDGQFISYCYKSKSRKYILIGSESTNSSEVRFIEADKPNSDFSIFLPREENHEYGIAHYKDEFYIQTNWKAKNFRLMKCPIEATEKKNWKEVIEHRDDVLLEGVEIFKEFLVVEERKNGLTEIRVIKWEDQAEHYLEFGEEVYTSWTSTNLDFNTRILRYGYTSMTTPSSVFDYNMESKEKTLLKQQEVLGEFNKDDYQAERLYATAKDGVKVPISLVYKKDVEIDNNNPLLLYGYGSYGSSMDPGFNSARLSLLNRGFVFAIAHIRGGEEMGRQWYEDGKLLNKKNTITDFIACSEYLIDIKYTSKEKLYAMGGSAGGLLVGAVMNMRPDLYKGIVAAVPFVDVVTTMLDESIPLTTGEYPEWGNPNEKEYYDYMLSYSPYDNVEPKDYPNILVTAGLHDSQVQYWEPAKWVAKLRYLKTDDNLLIMHTQMEAGHGGASGRFEYYKETALEYAFLLDLAGLVK
ncbi:MAG: S9 family peptidase [Bacteroidetes bacterium]|nr:S9 family peptidase [Bacteroidota bacterium]MBT4338940.1 S9 family peptidase [Bacteroidota bacterium]